MRLPFRRDRHALLPPPVRRDTWFIGFVVATATAIILLIVYVLNRSTVLDARHEQAVIDRAQQVQADAQAQAQIRDLACALVAFAPPGNPTGDALRAKYACPAFGSTVTPPAPSPRPATPTPSSIPTSGSRHTIPGPPRATPTPTITVTRTRVASSTPAPTDPPTVPRTTQRGGVGGVVCGVLPFVCVSNTP